MQWERRRTEKRPLCLLDPTPHFLLTEPRGGTPITWATSRLSKIHAPDFTRLVSHLTALSAFSLRPGRSHWRIWDPVASLFSCHGNLPLLFGLFAVRNIHNLTIQMSCTVFFESSLSVVLVNLSEKPMFACESPGGGRSPQAQCHPGRQSVSEKHGHSSRCH